MKTKCKSYLYGNDLLNVTNLFEKHVLPFCPHSSSQLLPVMRVIKNNIIGNLAQQQNERSENGKECIWGFHCILSKILTATEQDYSNRSFISLFMS